MAIAKPGKVLLHKIPLHFVHEKVAGGGKKGVDQSIPLVPFIDFLITLVVFLLMWERWTFPRLRIDQLLNLEWKYLIPISMANLVLMALMVQFGLHF